eukprot:SAG31_NODE_9346_length_1292_cov_1.186924_2_plen_100_part_01
MPILVSGVDQNLHRDIGPGDFLDPSGKIQIWDLPPYTVTINFPMVDFDNDVGPIRQIPGTQNTREAPPPVPEEPEWMKLSTVLGEHCSVEQLDLQLNELV